MLTTHPDEPSGDSVDIKDKVASAMKSSGLSAVRLFTASTKLTMDMYQGEKSELLLELCSKIR